MLRRRRIQGSLSPASRRGQTRKRPNVSKVAITSPHSRRVEDNAPYRFLAISRGHKEDLLDERLIQDVHFAAIGMQQKQGISIRINDGSIRADIVRQDTGGQ